MTEVASVGRQFFEAQDRLRGGPDDALCAPDYTADINGTHMDLDGHKEFADAFYAGFPDVQHVIEDIQLAGDAERVRFRLLGTHQAEFMGIPATGKTIDVSADAILIIVGGKVESIVASFDQVGLMQQLGH